MNSAARAGGGTALAAALLCAAMLAFFWPGIAMYDSVAQYSQVAHGAYDDWHPPVMARLWALLHLAWAGQAPMFVLQLALYWSGLGLVAAALARDGSRIAAGLTLALGIWPPFAGWQVAVLKDAQMAGALLAATGIACWWRLAARPLPRGAAAAIALLLLYATLLRFNAMFATVPLAIGLLGNADWRRPLPQGAALLAGCALVVAFGPWINHHVLGATPSGVERALPVYDLAGIAHHAGADAVRVLPAQSWRQAEARHCITPLLWDPLADETRCSFIAEGLEDSAPGHALFTAWVATMARHPVAYAAHRFAHWNMTMRFWVPARLPFAAPPTLSEPNALGLASPSSRIISYQKLAAWLAQGPLGSPALWLAGSLSLLALARPALGPRQQLAATLALSAAMTEFAFLLVSIASDLRYHLWAMLAGGLAALLLAGTPLPRRGAWAALAGLALVFGLCLMARLALPASSEVY